MADATSNVNVNVDVQVDGAKTVGTLKKELREAQGEALALSREFGELSPQAIAATKKVVQLKDEVNDLNERVALFDPGAKFMAFGNVVNAVGAGFTAAQGAMALFGSESEDLQKQLVKLQGAMAVSQGLSTLGDSWKDFQRLGAVIKTNVVGAFTTLRGAIAATGLGLIVLAIGALVANFESIEKWLKKIIPGFEGFAASFGKIKAVAMGVLNGIIESFKVIGEIVADVFTGDFSGAVDTARDAGSRIGKAYTEGFEEEVKDQAAEAARAIVRSQIEADEVRLRMLRAGGQKRAKEAAEVEKKIARAQIDAQVAGSKEQQEAIVAFAELLEKQRTEQAEKAEEDAKKAVDKRKEAGRKALEDLTTQQERELKIMTIQGKDIFNLKQRQLQEQKELYIKYGLELADIQNKQAMEELDRREALNGILQERVTNTTGIITSGLQNIGAAQAGLAQQAADIQVQTTLATEEAERRKQASMQATNDLLEVLVQDQENLSDIEKAAVLATMITTMFAEEGKRTAMEMTQIALQMATKVFGEETAAGKAFAIATATIETYKAAQMSFSAFAAIPIVGPALGAIAAAAAVVAGIARIRQITKVKVPGGDKGGSATPAADTSAPAMPRVQGDTGTMVQQLDQVNTNLQQPQRVQVVESDITNTQERVAKVKTMASF